MLPTSRLLMALLMLLALAGCSGREAPNARAPENAVPAAAPAMIAGDVDTATAAPENIRKTPARPASGASFTCDGGQHVDVGPDVAVVRLADGRAIEIRRDPADASRFVNEALEFAIAGDRAELAQDEGVTARCKAG